MTIADKLITIADNTAAVAEAVKASKATVEGAFIRVDDVVDRKHALEIRANEGTTVYVYGKNLFDMTTKQHSTALGCSSAVVNDELVITAANKNQYTCATFVIPNGELLVGKSITVTGEWVNSGANVGCLRLGWAGKDNVNSMVGNIGANKVSGNALTKTITVKPDGAGELCLWIYGNYDGTGEVGNTVTYRNIQVEVGSTATDYEAYKEPQIATATVDGKVLGLMSVSPTMTMISDGIIDICEYFPASSTEIYEKYQRLVQAENDLIAIL